MRQPTVAFFTVTVHLGRDLAVIESLMAGGLRVVAFGDHLAREGTEALGAEFVDIYDGDLGLTYDDSFPVPIRYVTFAGERAADVLRMVEPLHPGVVVLDSMAVVGRVVAQALGIPHVFVYSGHIRHAGHIPEIMLRPDLHVSERCAGAVARLREEWGIEDASPFLYRPQPSPYLNLYGEPPQWLPVEEREHYEPVRFFGSVSSRRVGADAAGAAPPPMFSEAAQLRVYAAFGASSILARAPQVLPTFEAIVDAVEGRPGAELVIGLGHHPRAALARRQSDQVRVDDYADQWSALAQADVFITHHGTKSTHEAVFLQVPMISYPLGSDQPGLARHCQELSLAVPLTRDQLGPVEAHDVLAALDRISQTRDAMSRALAQARTWEQMVVEGRPAIVEEIVSLCQRP